ncbi:MAG: hypothetical protein OXE59_10030 [Bacteroidetes bacterium]|nr:hypothetical protein [Bacteroidota bacterium]
MKFILVFLALIFPASVFAQHRADSLEVMFSQSRRSVPLALGMSALVPGSGQIYNRDWIKAAVALAGEATILFLYQSWHSRGIDGRDAYQLQAHTYWSPIRYAYWLNDYMTYLNQLPDGRTLNLSPIELSEFVLSINLQQPDTWIQSEQIAIRGLFDEIRRVERQVYHGSTGAAFSHVLPFFGEQQYYELIGKYFQYAPGWDDYVALVREGRITWVDQSGEFIPSIEPEAGEGDGRKENVSPRFYQYASDHADANGYLRRASRVTTLLLVNHVIAAVDAAIFARLHNQRIKLRLGLMQDNIGHTYVVPHLSFVFGH